jgi:hypothetical protein
MYIKTINNSYKARERMKKERERNIDSVNQY